jgi:VIT1/CCC1 family predicted Fe2+/Mn2+ transporter
MTERPPYEPHLGESRRYWRDIILGVNDGLVSTFLLIAGVVGGGLSVRVVLLTGIAGAIAGAISMSTGEWLATRSQEDVFDREVALEMVHLEHYRDDEVAQLDDMLASIGLGGDVLQAAKAYIAEEDERLLKTMSVLEFGLLEDERRSPWLAAFFSGGLFLAGALPSVVPFMIVTNANVGLLWAGSLTAIGLFTVGVVKGQATNTGLTRSGLHNLAVSLSGAILSYAVGRAYGASN